MMSVIGRKNAGKTTLLVALAAELARRKFRVMTIKHGTHPADTDQRGKDSWRHWHEGHAERVLMEGPGQRVLWEKTEAESDPVALARRYLDGADIVLVEGYKRAALPKIEVYRLAAGAAPQFDTPGCPSPSRPRRSRCARRERTAAQPQPPGGTPRSWAARPACTPRRGRCRRRRGSDGPARPGPIQPRSSPTARADPALP